MFLYVDLRCTATLVPGRESGLELKTYATKNAAYAHREEFILDDLSKFKVNIICGRILSHLLPRKREFPVHRPDMRWFLKLPIFRLAALLMSTWGEKLEGYFFIFKGLF